MCACVQCVCEHVQCACVYVCERVQCVCERVQCACVCVRVCSACLNSEFCNFGVPTVQANQIREFKFSNLIGGRDCFSCKRSQ